MTVNDLELIADHIDKICRPLYKRMADLETELRATRQSVTRQASGWRGVWQDGTTYAPGELATYGGTLWHCNAATTDRPGTSDGWSLMVKNQMKGNDR